MTSLPTQSSDRRPLLVSSEDTTTPDSRANEQSIDIAAQLHVDVKKVKKFLKKNPGDRIKPGDVLASRKKFITRDDIISKTSGTILRFEHDTGKIYILTNPTVGSTITVSDSKPTSDASPIDGTEDMWDNNRILPTTDKNGIVGEKGQGQSVTGELLYIVAESQGESGPARIALHQLDAECIGKIILGESFDREVLVKAVSMGVLGIIGHTIADEDFSYLSEKHPDVPVVQVGDGEYTKLVKYASKQIHMQGKNKSILLQS